jgi:hypothetical protein
MNWKCMMKSNIKKAGNTRFFYAILFLITKKYHVFIGATYEIVNDYLIF